MLWWLFLGFHMTKNFRNCLSIFIKNFLGCLLRFHWTWSIWLQLTSLKTLSSHSWSANMPPFIDIFFHFSYFVLCIRLTHFVIYNLIRIIFIVLTPPLIFPHKASRKYMWKLKSKKFNNQLAKRFCFQTLELSKPTDKLLWWLRW